MGQFPDNRKVVSLQEGRRVRARHDAERKRHAQRVRWVLRLRKTPVAVAVVGVLLVIAGGVFLYDANRYAKKFGSWDLAFKHMAAAPNCDAARRAGLANARKGQPGYYPKHDADNDGIACEPFPR